MKISKIFAQYFLFICFVYAHDLNHADPVTVKQPESIVNIDTLGKNIDTSNIPKNENENPRFRVVNDIRKSNEEQIQSPTPSVDILSQNSVRVLIQNDITTPSIPVQKSIPLVSDTIKNIPISNDKFNVKETIPAVQTQIKEESHNPSPSNSNAPDIKPDQHEKIPISSTQTIAGNESHSTTAEHHQNIRIHPRHMQINQPQIEENIKTDVNQSENETAVGKSQPAVTIDNKTQKNDQSVTNTDSLNPKSIIKPNISTDSPIDNATTIPSFIVHDNNTHSSNETNEILIKNTSQTTDNNTNEKTRHMTPIPAKLEDNNRSILLSSISTGKIRQICWHLPKTFEPSIELLENEIFRFINVLPEFLQTIFFGPINDREVLMNTIWFCSICTMCFFFSFFFLSLGTKRLKQNKQEKEIRARCQQLQQYSNQIELERATFERQNQKLTDEIDELKTLPVRDIDEDVFTLRNECVRFQEDIKTVRIERDTLQQDLEYKQNLLQKYEYDFKEQTDTVTNLNNEIVQLKQELEKERTNVNRLQSHDLSLENLEKYQEIIQQLKSEITQLKQDKFVQKDQLQEIQEHTNKLDIENNQLTLRMKQLKDLLEQRNQLIKELHEKIDNSELKDLFTILSDNPSNDDFLSIIDNDIEKSSQHIHDLHRQINEKTCRIKELENLFKQEKDHYKEIETKLKVVLELRERDAHLHIRQMGQTDAELRKARTDTERVRILQQQLELKQQQLDDIQKVLSNEQIKFNEESSKLQHEIHEKWMEVKRLTRELEASKKESEGYRRQITKYANNERSLQEKSILKPIPQNLNESESNGTSPIAYQQGENFRPIGDQRNDSGATSPNEMLIPRPPLFGLSRPPFFPAAFLPHPPSHPFIMPPRLPLPVPVPHGIRSPIPHLLINNTELNNSQINDSSISTNYETQSNAAAEIISPISENDKPKKPKKSLKKKSRTSIIKEDV